MYSVHVHRPSKTTKPGVQGFSISFYKESTIKIFHNSGKESTRATVKGETVEIAVRM